MITNGKNGLKIDLNMEVFFRCFQIIQANGWSEMATQCAVLILNVVLLVTFLVIAKNVLVLCFMMSSISLLRGLCLLLRLENVVCMNRATVFISVHIAVELI